MIISKYSGNVVGYLDYYAGIEKRVSAVARTARSQRVRRDGGWPDMLVGEYVRFCRAQGSAVKFIKRTGISKPKSCAHIGIYDCCGVYWRYYGIGRLLDIRI